MDERREAEDERRIIERAKDGDSDAQDELCRQHMPGLHAWVRLKRSDLLAERESSLDLVQTVFREALVALPRFEYRGKNSFRNWLLTYADNKLRNREQFHRAERRHPAREVDASLSQFYGSINSPSKALDAQEGIERFERGFAQLSANDQQIIMLARVEQLPHARIAERLGISEDASKKALSRALARLAIRVELP